MKALFKNLILNIFKLLSKIYIYIYKIEVVAITGSAGKTTAKNTIKILVQDRPDIYVPDNNYNTEIGVPLLIFKEQSPKNVSNILSWFGMVFKLIIKLFKKPNYKTIVLEYGADKPGDIKYLCNIARPKISLITTVLPVHIEGFGSIKDVAFEKKSLIWLLKKDGIGIINGDNEYLNKDFKDNKNVLLISKENTDADYYISNIKSNIEGLSFDLLWKDQKYKISAPIIGEHLIYSIVGAIAVALALGVDIKIILTKLNYLSSEKGRMSLIKTSRALIIDDSYNSNPKSLIEALKFLGKQKGRRIAVLGNMNELGPDSDKIHSETGEYILRNVDILFTIGDVAGEFLAKSFEKDNLDNVYKFREPYSAGIRLNEIIKKGDIVLFKGSQNGVFAEEAIVPILDNPEDAEKLLVRQNSFWKNKKNKFIRSIK